MDYYTVAQYAILFGKDPGNIRRMLKKGIINGEKLGNQWVIPKDEKYPEDRRVKSGDYKNWRRSLEITKNNRKLIKMLKDMSCKFNEICEGNLDKVVLYGSYARGEQTIESDVDIAVFLRNDPKKEKNEELLEAVIEFEINLGITISVVPIMCEEYKTWAKTIPFYKNLEKEGIVIWKVA